MHRFFTALLLVLTVVSTAPSIVRAQEASPSPSPPADIVESTVTVDGRGLHLACVGDGSPTVLFEPGGPSLDGGTSLVAAMGPDLAAALGTRFCAYDRAGIGGSDPYPGGVRTFREAAADLHAVLASPELDCPCVVIGESLGGAIALVAVAEGTTGFAGLVLLDPPYPGFYDEFLALVPPDSPEAGPDLTSYLGGENEEQLDMATGFRQVAAPAAPLDIPVVLVTHGTGDPPPCFPCSEDFPVADLERGWQAGQADLSQAIGGRFVVAKENSHFIAPENPELVVAVTEDVIAAVRDPSTWATPGATPGP